MEDLKRGKHKIVSVSHTALNSVAFPLVRSSHKYFFKGTSIFASFVNSTMNSLDTVTNENLS